MKATATTTAAPTRLAFLDGLRGLAATYVVVSHTWDTVFAADALKDSPLRAATAFMGFGRYAVALFILISGFSLGLVAWRNDFRWPGGTRSFAYRRVKRIVPPYAVAVLLSSLLGATLLAATSGSLWDEAIPIRLSGVLSHLFLVQDVAWGGPAGSTAFWSIAIEFHIYFFFAAMLFVLRRRESAWLGAFVLLAGLAVVGAMGPETGPLHTVDAMWPSLYALFLLGVAGARFAVPGKETDPRRWELTLVAMAISGVVVVVLCASRFDPLGPLMDLWLGPLIALVLTRLARGRMTRTRELLSTRPMRWLGESSYSLYLTHAAVIEIVWRFVVKPLDLGVGPSLVLECVLGVLAAIAVSRVFYRWVERPFVNTKRAAAAPQPRSGTSASPQPSTASVAA